MYFVQWCHLLTRKKVINYRGNRWGLNLVCVCGGWGVGLVRNVKPIPPPGLCRSGQFWWYIECTIDKQCLMITFLDQQQSKLQYFKFDIEFKAGCNSGLWWQYMTSILLILEELTKIRANKIQNTTNNKKSKAQYYTKNNINH